MKKINWKIKMFVSILVMGLIISSCTGKTETNNRSGAFILNYSDINFKHNINKSFVIELYYYLSVSDSKNGILQQENNKAMIYDDFDLNGIDVNDLRDTSTGEKAKPNTKLSGILNVICTKESSNEPFCDVTKIKFELSKKDKDGTIIGSESCWGKPSKEKLRKGDKCEIEYDISVPEEWVDNDDDECKWRLDIYWDDSRFGF